MMNNKFKISLICAAVIALTGCNDDDTDTSGLEQQIKTLETQNAQLESDKAALQETTDQALADNESLVSDNAALQAKATSYISTFQEQCAEEGVNFEYENPNPDNPFVNNAQVPMPQMTSTSIGTYAATPLPEDHEGRDNSTCTSCHSAQAPDVHYGENCTSCHTFEAPEPGPDPDPGAPDTPTHPADGNWDALTGASAGTFYYNKDGASFVNAAFLNTRFGKMNSFYEWKASDSGVKTVKSACGLPNREHITTKFPDDGNAYVLSEYKNFKGAATFVTQREENGQSIASAATFGPSMHLGDDGEYYVTLLITKNNTCKNLVDNNAGEIHYYEFDTRSSVKLGSPDMGPRNAGARIQVTTDYNATELRSYDWATPVYGGNGQAFDPAIVDWTAVGACSLSLKVETIYPLG
ncbi:hypothetical protein [Shewanella maritima]|uniref:hypothetical protein n=1 Tax=Shewanella maritima TaxID=2520507 RepID=UPI00373568D2